MLIFIWAEANQHVIGNHGKVPWNLPNDRRFFVQQTKEHAILAGRKTFASFRRPLPNRQNMVLTSKPASEFPESVSVFHSVSEFLQYDHKHPNEKIYVVGGTEIYRQLLPNADYLVRTKIDLDVQGDTKMCPIDYSQFELVKKQAGIEDEKNKYPYQFEFYQRKKI